MTAIDVFASAATWVGIIGSAIVMTKVALPQQRIAVHCLRILCFVLVLVLTGFVKGVSAQLRIVDPSQVMITVYLFCGGVALCVFLFRTGKRFAKTGNNLLLILFGLCPTLGPIWAEEPKREQIGQVLGKPVYRDQVTREGRGTLAEQVHEVLHRPVMKKYFQDYKADLKFTEEELTFAAHYLDEKLVNEHNEFLKSEADRKTAKKSIRSELSDIQIRLASDTPTDQSREELLKQNAAAEKRLKDSRENFRSLMNVMPEPFFSPKLSRHLYEKYEGGRVLVSEWGLIAFDAYLRCLNERESLGEFEITDPRIREAVKDDLASWEKQPRRGTSFLSDKREHIQEVLNPPCLPKRKDDPAQKTKHTQENKQMPSDGQSAK